MNAGRSRAGQGALGLLATWLGACGGPAPAPPPAAAPDAAVARAAAASPPPDLGVAASPSPALASGPVKGTPSDEDPAAATAIQAEAHERDPRSRSVKVKLTITPEATGVVLWGRKRLAELAPGHMSFSVERPRSSGPVDLVVRAAGFLPHHVRMFSDRDDQLALRLYRPEEAPGLLGYPRAGAPAPPPAGGPASPPAPAAPAAAPDPAPVLAP